MDTVKKISDLRIEFTENGANVKWCETTKDSGKPYDDQYRYKELSFIKGVEGEYGIDKIGDFMLAKIKEGMALHGIEDKSEEKESPKIEIEIKS
jgi:hypothetical protein